MEVKEYKNKVTIEGDNIFLSSYRKEQLTFDESFKYTNNLLRAQQEISGKKVQLEAQIKQKAWEKELEYMDRELELAKDVHAQLEKALEPRVEELKKTMKKYIKGKKAERGYSRISDDSQKHKLRSEIMAKAMEDLDLPFDDISHPIAIAVTREFEKI